MPADLPILVFRDQKTWAAWLTKNHGKSSGVWLRMAKKASGLPSVSHAEVLEVALERLPVSQAQIPEGMPDLKGNRPHENLAH